MIKIVVDYGICGDIRNFAIQNDSGKHNAYEWTDYLLLS